MTETVDLNFLAKLCQKTLAEVGSLRKEVGDLRTVTLQLIDYTRRMDRRMTEMDRRMTELKDDLGLIFKAEIGGRFSNLERQVENMLAPLVGRIETLETR